jgi:hypothetical protein
MKQLWFACVICLLGAVQGWAAPLSVAGFARDRVVFDAGAAFGRDAADIPVAGQAAPGAAVEIRVINDRTGAAGAWQSAGVADAAGRWQASLTQAAGPDWYRVEARAGGEQAVAETRFGTGDVVGILGQSEFELIWSPFHSKRERVPQPPLETDQVQFTLQDGRGKLSHSFAGADATHAMRALASFWIANAPAGRRLHVVDLTQSGTARAFLQDDANPKRTWADLEAVVAAAGAPIGLVLESWFAGDRGTGLAWAQRFMPLYTGTTLEGRDFKRGSRDTKGVPVDHFLWDITPGQEGLFKVGQTALGVFGPHRFDSDKTLAGPTTKADGKVDFGMRAVGQSRQGMAAFLAQDQVQGILTKPALPQPLDYANGSVDPATGRLTDTPHPSLDTPDGLQRLAKHVANAALYALGHRRYDLPQLDQVEWTADAVELGSSTGKITTAQQARGAGQGRVAGFDIGGRAVARAELTPQGRIRLYPNKGRKFRAGDVIGFGMGGAGGLMNPTQDWQAQAYLTYPIVDVGLKGLEGVAVMPGVTFTLGR